MRNAPRPPRPDLTGGPAPFRLSGSPRTAVVMLFVLLAVVAATWTLIGRYGAEPAAPPPEMSVPPKTPRLERVGDEQLALIVPEETRDELEQELLAWFRAEGRRPISDSDAVDEDEWVGKLLSRDVRSRLDHLPARVFGELSDVERLRDEPGLHRGRLVGIRGRIEEPILEVPLGEEARAAWLIVLREADDTLWTVTTPREPPPGVEAGDWVRIEGVFTKLWPFGEPGRRPFHLFTTRAIVPSFPPVTVTEPSLEWFAQVRDDTPEASQRLTEEPPFWLLMNYVRTMGKEGYEARKRAGELVPVDLTGTRGTTPLANEPEKHRFQLVRLRLAPLVKEFVTDSEVEENPGNIDTMFRGFLVDDQMRAVRFVSSLPREAFDLDAATRIATVEGFFYKRVAIETADGKRYWMPVIVGTSIQGSRMRGVGGGAVSGLAIWIVGAASVAAIAVLLVSVFRNRRQLEETRRRSAERRMGRAGERAG